MPRCRGWKILETMAQGARMRGCSLCNGTPAEIGPDAPGGVSNEQVCDRRSGPCNAACSPVPPAGRQRRDVRVDPFVRLVAVLLVVLDADLLEEPLDRHGEVGVLGRALSGVDASTAV